MIMGIWRYLAAIALLAHLVTLSVGNTEGEVKAFEKLLASNVSIVVIDDNADGPVNLNKLKKTFTNASTGYDSVVGLTNRTNLVDENELVVELEEALVNAAASGRVMLVAPPDNQSNATALLPGPVLVIENSNKKSPKTLNKDSSRENEKLRARGSSDDLEIAQSQIRQRTTSGDYVNDDDLENFDDLLAIAEYEPQRIDAKIIDDKNYQVNDDQLKPIPESTTGPRDEETHYDVPKQKNPSKNNSRTISDSAQRSFNDGLSLQSPASIENRKITSQSNPTESDPPTTFTVHPSKRNFAKKRRIQSSTINKKPSPIYQEVTRDTRNSGVFSPPTTNPSASRKFTDDAVINNDHQPFVSGSSENRLEARLKNIQNLTNVVDLSTKKFNSNPIQTTRESLITTQYPLSQLPVLSADAGTLNRPNQLIPLVPRASKRNDDYWQVDDVTSKNEQLEASNNQQLGHPKRHIRPSLVTRHIPEAQLHPVGSLQLQAKASEDPAEEELSYDEDSHEAIIPTRSRTAIPVDDFNERSEHTTSEVRTNGKPGFVGHQRVHDNGLGQKVPSDDYKKDWRSAIVMTNPSEGSYLQNVELSSSGGQEPEAIRILNRGIRNEVDPRKLVVKNSLVAGTAIPNHESYQQRYETHRDGRNLEAVRRLKAVNPQVTDGRYSREFPHENVRVAGTTIPPHDSYEQNVKEAPAGLKLEPVHSFKVGNPQARRTLEPRTYAHENSQVAAITVPSYESYEKVENSNLPEQQHTFSPSRRQKQWTTKNAYIVPNKQVERTHDNLETSAQSVTSTSSLTENPIYQLQGVKTNPGSIVTKGIHNHRQNYHQNWSLIAQAPQNSFNDTKNPLQTSRRLRNQNNGDPHNNLNNDYHDYENIKQSTISLPTKNQNSKQISIESLENPYFPYQTKVTDKSSQFVQYDPQTRVNFATVESVTPAYVVNSDNDDNKNFNDEAIYVAQPRTKFRVPKRSNPLELINRKYENDENGSAKLNEFDGVNYGNRVRPRVVVDEEKKIVGFHRATGLTAPDYDGGVGTNNQARRRVYVDVEKAPVESVHRADVEEVPYEDEVSENSEHAGDQATRQTHATAVQSGGGGGAHDEQQHEEGGGEKHEEDHHETHGEKGDKGYDDYHEYDKGKKGHHDKEGHDNEYDEKKGNEKKHEEESGYHKEHHHGEKGDKESEFGEKGEHEKGHSTKGQHVVHKKDEYEKKTEFYDESHEEDGDEKEGEYHEEHESKKGGHEKKGHHDSAHHQNEYGEKGEHEKGHHYHENKEHDGKAGKDRHHQHHEKYGKKGGHEDGFKWSHQKGDDGHGGGSK